MKADKAPPAQLERPPQRGRVRSVILAVLVHAIFFALIFFGVTWQSHVDAPLEAELWDKIPNASPPKKAVEPQPPRPEPEPTKPEPVKPPPEPVKEQARPEPPRPDPEIARKLEREKAEKQKKEKERQEKERKEKADREKQQAEDARKKREDEARKKEDERVRQEMQQAREAAATQHQKEFNEWVGKIRDKIRGKANVPDTVTGHPEVLIHLRILPGGEVFDIAIVKPSGNPAYDAAIERAVRSASPLPVPPTDSELFSQFRDLNLKITHDR